MRYVESVCTDWPTNAFTFGHAKFFPALCFRLSSIVNIIALAYLLPTISFAATGFQLEDTLAVSDWLTDGIAISGDTAVYADLNANSAYVFKRSGTSWSLSQTLTPPLANVIFIDGIALDGNSLLLTGRGTSGGNNGGGFVFEDSGSGFMFSTRLISSTDPSFSAGQVVGLSGDSAIMVNAGVAHIYTRPGAAWSGGGATLTESTQIASLNARVEVVGDTFFIGNRDSSNNAILQIYERILGVWTGPQATLSNPSGATVLPRFDGNTVIGVDINNFQTVYVWERGTGWVDTGPTATLSVTQGRMLRADVSGDTIAASVEDTPGGTAISLAIFDQPSGGWVDGTETQLIPAGTDALMRFGIAVDNLTALSGPVAFVATGGGVNGANLVITKVASAAQVLATTNFTYTIGISNLGPDDATGVTVTDTLPPQMAFVSSAPAGLCQQTGGSMANGLVLTCAFGNLASLAIDGVDITATAPATAGPTTNTASVTATEPDPDGMNNTDSALVTVTLPGVDVTDTVNNTMDSLLNFGLVAINTMETGTVTVTNNQNIDLTIASIAGPPLSAPYSISGLFNCYGVTLSMGQSCTMTVNFAPTVVNTFNDAFTLDFGLGVAQVSVTGGGVVAQGDLSVTKTVDNLHLMSASDVATFMVTVAYTGVSPAEIIVTDVLPAQLVPAAGVAPMANPGTYAPDGDWTLTLDDGAPPGTLTIPVQAAANANGCATNTATGRFDDPNFTNNDASDDQASQTIAVIGGCADLQASVNFTDDAVNCLVIASFSVTRTTSITNLGPTSATGVVATSFPTATTCTSANPCTIPVGATATVSTDTISHSCEGPDIDSSVNVSVVSSGTDDPDPNNDSVSETFTIVRLGSSGSGGPCFIATAAYGSYLEPEVQLLQTFRDRHLLTNSPGRVFVAWYYRNSPALAGVIAESEVLRVMTRLALTPLILSIKHPVVTGYLLFCVIVIPIGWRRRIRLRKSAGFI